MRLIFLFFFVLILSCTFSHGMLARAQDGGIDKKSWNPALYLGVGVGLDYGGIGLKGSFEPIPYLSVFGGVGNNLVSISGGAGMAIHMLPARKVSPKLMGMYGYNSVLIITQHGFGGPVNDYVESQGVSVGAGIDMKWWKRPHKLSVAVLYPFRDGTFMSRYNRMYNKPFLMPVLFSVGWNFSILN